MEYKSPSRYIACQNRMLLAYLPQTSQTQKTSLTSSNTFPNAIIMRPPHQVCHLPVLRNSILHSNNMPLKVVSYFHLLIIKWLNFFFFFHFLLCYNLVVRDFVAWHHTWLDKWFKCPHSLQVRELSLFYGYFIQEEDIYTIKISIVQLMEFAYVR